MNQTNNNNRKQVLVPHNFTPREYQLKLFKALDGGKKRAILRWHRRAGKDKCCWAYQVKEAAKIAGNYFYVFPTKTMARQALWENVDSSGFKLLNHIPSELIVRKSNQEMVIELHNGSTIRVIGYDKNPDSIRGIACKGAVFSEFAFSDPESYKTMIPALRETNGWAIFNSTPNGRNHFYDLWQNVKDSPRWYSSIMQTYWPNRPGYSGLIKPEEFPFIKDEEGLTEEDVEREYGSSFSTGMKGSFYMDEIEKAASEGRISEFLPIPSKEVDTFWDLGVDDSTAVWFVQKRGNANIFIDYYENSGKSIQHYVEILERKGYRYGTHYLPHDARQRSLQTGTTTSDIFESYCNDYKVDGYVEVLERLPIQDGINAARSKFSTCVFNSITCKEGIHKLELYHRKYDKRRQVFLKEPVHDLNSHAADAFRMWAIHDDQRNDAFYKINNKFFTQANSTWDPLED
jgi:hypothetical protein